MLNVNPVFVPSQYNTSGELACNNGGALFSNNVTESTTTVCTVSAQWNIPDNSDCYTGI